MTTEHSNDPTLPPASPPEAGIADPLIRITTALAVASVAAVAAVISSRHAYELVTTHGETGLTARLLPLTVDGLILAASMLILDASRRHQRVPPLARWCLGGRHRGHYRRQPGSRPRPRTNRCAGQRLASPGLGRILRTAHDPHPSPATRPTDSLSAGSRAPSRIHGGAQCTTICASWRASGGADSPGLAQCRPQPARHSPRTRHRPPQNQAHHRPPHLTPLPRTLAAAARFVNVGLGGGAVHVLRCDREQRGCDILGH
jgi:Protein of unknown function (DUF2637)